MAKVFAPQLVAIVSRLCDYWLKHEVVLKTYLQTVLSPADYLAVVAALNSVTAACSILKAIVFPRRD